MSDAPAGRGASRRVGGIDPLLLLGGGGLIAWPLLFGSPYELRLLAVAGCYALATLGYQFIFGRAGALSLAQGTFFGVGAYATGILAGTFGWGFASTFPLSVLLPMLLAALIAAPVLRLESHYFALATLGIGQVALLAAINWQGVTGGANGLPGVPGIILFGWPVPRGLPTLAAVWLAVALGAWLARRLTRGLYGFAFVALRDSPFGAATLGLDAGRLRFAAFLLSAAYAGAGGALHAHVLRVVSPETLGFPITVACLAMTVVGGRDRIAGALVGAVLLVHLPEWFRGLDLYRNVAYGAALLAAIVAAPYGLVGTIERWRARLLPEAPTPAPAPSPLPLVPRPAPGAGGSAPLLEIANLGKSFGGVAAVDGVDLQLRRGEIVGLIGPNGSGKTTLVNLVSGVERPDRGAVRFAGTDIAGWEPYRIARRGIARTFQTMSLIGELTALDNVALARGVAEERAKFSAALTASSRDPALAGARAEAMHLLAACGAAAAAMRPADALPHGVKRRVEIARALALRPAILLLDEPAAGLAENEQADLARLLVVLAAEGIGLVVVEHNMNFLMRLAHRLVCLDQGRVIAAGPPAEIRRDPRVIEAYLGAPEGSSGAPV